MTGSSDRTSDGPRPRAVRRRDTERRLAHDVDVWVASASVDGVPYLVPLSFDWDGGTLLVATPPTARPAGTWPRPGPLGWRWASPATCP